MVLISDKTYEETREILLGKIKISQVLRELNDWFFNTFSINIINFEFDKLKHTQMTYRLLIIFRHPDEHAKMYNSHFEMNKDYQEAIANKFREIALRCFYTDKSTLEKIFVAFIDFSVEAKTAANWKAFDKANKVIRKKFPEVWHMLGEFESSVVFYFEDKDIAAHNENGTSKKITDKYYSILKKYDEFNYFTTKDVIINFDSKENFDSTYKSNFFYYSKR